MEEEIEQDLDKGQHFLIDPEIIKKELKIANISKKDKILEIGAGKGDLTLELAKFAGEVTAFEIDERYSEKLKSLEEKNKNLKIILEDAFKSSWKKYNKIVSNIPYFISEKLIKKAIEEDIKEMVLIVGENFKNNLEKNQSKTGIIANMFYDIEFVMKVKSSCFFPAPRVDSWLVKFEKKNKMSEIDSILISILNKNGKTKNAILYSLVEEGETKRESREIIKRMKLNETSLEKPPSEITEKFLIRLKEGLEKYLKE